MRAYEFVLLEYKRSTTINIVGAEKIQAKLNQIGKSDLTPENFLEMAEAADSTPKKKYVPWILNQFMNHGLSFEEIVNGPNGQLYKDIEYFDALTPQQRKADGLKSDIGGYNYRALRADVVKSQNTAEDQFEPEPLNYEHSDQMKIVNKKTRRFGDLIIPESHEASCELGSGTRWCTASRDRSEPFDDYSRKGPLYVWIPSLSKQVERDRSISRKFQFHFPSGQMTDEADRQLKPDEINYFRTSHPVLSRLFKQQEAIISQNAELAYDYANNVINGRWPEGEPAIVQNAHYAHEYAKDVIKSRWPEAEKIIAKNSYYAYEYAREVIKDRWTDPKSGIDAEIAKTAEKTIAQDLMPAYSYARSVIKGRWTDPEFGIDAEIAKTAETTIAQNAPIAHYYANNVIKGRWPEAEETIAQNAEYAYEYARDVINGRWPEAEETIAKNASLAYEYAKDVINGRWPEGEPTIAKSARIAHLYARSVIKGRWTDPEFGIDAEIAKTAEETIAQDVMIARFYAEQVIKDRWLEAEPAIARSNSYIKDLYAGFLVSKGYINNIKDFR